MEKIKMDDYLDYEEKLLEKGKGRRREKRPPTKSSKEGHKQEIHVVKQARVEEIEQQIGKHLSSFPKWEAKEGQKQVQSYLEWLKTSMKLKSPQLNWAKEVRVDSFVSSVKAGGQHRQKNLTAVRLTHLPTLIAVKNEDERSFEQNKEKAKTALFEKLEEHLNLWQTLVKNSPGKINIANKVFSLTKRLGN